MSPTATHRDPAAAAVADRRPDQAATAATAPAEGTSPVEADVLVEEDLLVEDVSIDGMCGVY
jgi:mycofactocin precursor